MFVNTSFWNKFRWLQLVSFQYNIEKKVNDEDEDEDDSDFEGSKKAMEEDLDGMACKFANLYLCLQIFFAISCCKIFVNFAEKIISVLQKAKKKLRDTFLKL